MPIGPLYKSPPESLVYGRDPRLPTETVLSEPVSPNMVDIEDYRTELASKLSLSRATAKGKIEKAQEAQKRQYDKRTQDLSVGDQVMVYMPG